jgi:UDP-glucose 4-epimerase
MVEQALSGYDRAYGLKSAILRYFNAAGADPEGEIGEARAIETHLLPLALDAMLCVRPPLKIYGVDYPTPDGTAIRDYIHVSDLADAHVAALKCLMDRDASFVANLGAGTAYSVNQVITSIERVTNRHVPGARRAGDPPQILGGPVRSHPPPVRPRNDHTDRLALAYQISWRPSAELDLERSGAYSPAMDSVVHGDC